MEILKKYFSDFTAEQESRFRALEPLYREWNARINVISRKDIDSLYEKHVLHSLAIAAVFDFPDGCRVIDIGTGGGFPGVPLAIFFPGASFLLADSIGKKLTVIDAVVRELGMENIQTMHSRAEDIRGHQFDFAVSRAVAPLKDLVKWSMPLLRKSSFTTEDHSFASGLVCLKGGDLSAEIRESGTRPRVMPVSDLFEEDYFREKYLVYVPLQTKAKK